MINESAIHHSTLRRRHSCGWTAEVPCLLKMRSYQKTCSCGLLAVAVPEPVPEPFLISFTYAFVQVHLLVLYYYYSIGNIRVCYTIPYLVVLRVLQDMLVVLEILLYFVKLLYGSSINRRSSCSIQLTRLIHNLFFIVLLSYTLLFIYHSNILRT